MCDLRDHRGSFLRKATREECKTLEAKGDIERCGASTYRERRQVQPSASRNSQAQLTNADMRVVANLLFDDGFCSVRERQRLVGHKVLVPNQQEAQWLGVA